MRPKQVLAVVLTVRPQQELSTRPATRCICRHKQLGHGLQHLLAIMLSGTRLLLDRICASNQLATQDTCRGNESNSARSQSAFSLNEFRFRAWYGTVRKGAENGNENPLKPVWARSDHQRHGIMSFLRKASTGALRNFRPKSGSSEGSFFGEGARTDKNGLLFGETPPPPGQKRKWESWEAPWYAKHILSLGPSLLCTCCQLW